MTTGIHNLSTYQLSEQDIALLTKGLSFAPTPNTPTQTLCLQTLRAFDDYAKSLRLKYLRAQYTKTASLQHFKPSFTSYLYRPMKFVPRPTCETPKARYSGVSHLEQYIYTTKTTLDDNLPTVCNKSTNNLPKPQQTALTNLKKARQYITIKPADKNLGIVLMDTDDYITQCMAHLTDTTTYTLTHTYPSADIKRQIQNTLVHFKDEIEAHNKHLYKFLHNTPKQPQTPQFYGIPKIHKTYSHLPPLRPIVSQTNSILSPTARLIDHTLQPLAQSYPDYLHNSTALSLLLQDLHIPDDAILVTIDVTSLYPSIPQTECLDILYNETHQYPDLLIFDPNLIIHLLHSSVNYNYFSFAHHTFQQVKGTAMGAAFSPTIANIFMSKLINNFLKTQHTQPLLLKRYIDDIFLIWTDTMDNLLTFLTTLNNFHPSIHFTHQLSLHTVDFLDLTIYKSRHFTVTNLLDTRTYQKPLNLYQYLHYSSHHQTNIYRSIIQGEAIRYVRTNTLEETYTATLHMFTQRLRKRGYPNKLIHSVTANVKYRHRQRYLQRAQPPRPKLTPPIYKCLPPPQFQQLKQITLHNYKHLHLPTPRFIALRYPTLQNEVVRAKLTPSDEQFVDLVTMLESISPAQHTEAAKLPKIHPNTTNISPCHHPRCSTCSTHLIYQPTFQSTRTRKSYRIRHSFTCQSKNLIYLITCTKCQKQYVGLTTQQLNVRINHHRSNILTKKQICICKHFNQPDHSLSHLSVQPIDCPNTDKNTFQELQTLERYWISTLRTKYPQGLNISPGN